MRFRWWDHTICAIAAVPAWHCAERNASAAAKLAQVKTPYRSSLLLREMASFQATVGRAEALWGSARSFLFATVGNLWDEVSSAMARRCATSVGAACLHTGGTMPAKAVDLMYNAGGAVAVRKQPTGALLRDVHACTRHIATSTDSYGARRVLLGLDPGRSHSSSAQRNKANGRRFRLLNGGRSRAPSRANASSWLPPSATRSSGMGFC